MASSPDITKTGSTVSVGRLHTGPNGQMTGGRTASEHDGLTLEEALNRLEIENRVKEGAENMLQVLDTRIKETPKETRDARRVQVMEELRQATSAIQSLKLRIHVLSASSPISDKLAKRIRGEEPLSSRPKLSTIRSYSSSAFPGMTSPLSPLQRLGKIVEELLDISWPVSHYISRCNALVSILKCHPEVIAALPAVFLKIGIPRLCSAGDSNLAAAGFRIARHVILLLKDSDLVFSTILERCILTVLAQDDRHVLNREHALKLARVIALSPETPPHRLMGLVRALISVADTDERLCALATETLTELFILSPDLMRQTGGIACLLRSLVDGPQALSDEIVMAFLLHLESPSQRQYIGMADLEIIFSCFTEHTRSGAADEDALISATAVLLRMINTWPGLIAMSPFHFRGLASVFEALRVRSNTVRDGILDFLFSALSIPVNSMTTTFLAGKRLTTTVRIPMSATAQVLPETARRKEGDPLLTQFRGLKLHLFLQMGLLDSLMQVVGDHGDLRSSRKATLLIGEILQLSTVLLPLNVCRHLQSLPALFATATDFANTDRLLAMSALYQIESLYRTRNKASATKVVDSQDSDNVKRGQRQVEQVKIKMGLQIDDAHFRNLLLDTQVLNTKNYAKWHWDTLTELVQGPLLNPKRLEESIKATKFMKRLLAFYRPFTHRFSSIKNTKPNQKYIKFGCLLLNTLLANPEGYRYLIESKLMRQLSECLAQLDPMNSVPAQEILFTETRLEDTLCHGYFEMVGTLTAHSKGIATLERWRMFTSLYHLTELRSRIDLITAVLPHMDYSYEGHPRVILSKALMSGPKVVRLEATKLLGQLTEQNDDNSSKVADWALRLLTTQLYDPVTEVCEAAVQVLERACNSRHHLEHVVQLRPALDHLGEIGAPLLLRFLATSVGFQYLQETSYVERELDDWHHGGDDAYVIQAEAVVFHLQSPQIALRNVPSPAVLPAHLYGELAKTAEGCALIVSKGRFLQYVCTLQDQPRSLDAEDVRKSKAALWAIGNIGATERGAPFLEGSEAVASIVQIAQRSPFISLRATAYIVLGLISNTLVGVRLLEQSGWHAVVTRMGLPTGICMPSNARDVLELSNWTTPRPAAMEEVLFPELSMDLFQGLQRDVALALSNLSNHMLANDAARQLVRLRQRYPEAFFTKQMHDRAFDLLARYDYKQNTRRFLISLFKPESESDLASADGSSTERSASAGRFGSSIGPPASLSSLGGRVQQERRRSGMSEDDLKLDVLAQRRKLFNGPFQPLVRSRRSQTID